MAAPRKSRPKLVLYISVTCPQSVLIIFISFWCIVGVLIHSCVQHYWKKISTGIVHTDINYDVLEMLRSDVLSVNCHASNEQDYVDTQMLLSSENVNQEALLCYAREAADFGTNYQLPTLDFAMNHCGQPDVAMFDFTSMHASENAALVRERFGHQLLVALVGDSLLEVRRSKLCHVNLIHFRWVWKGCRLSSS